MMQKPAEPTGSTYQLQRWQQCNISEWRIAFCIVLLWLMSPQKNGILISSSQSSHFFLLQKEISKKKCILLQTEICLCWGSEQYFLLHSVATSSLLNIIVDASNKFGLSTFRDHSSKKYIFWAFWEVYLWEVDMLWIGLSKGSTISNRRWINHFCLCVLYEATWSNTTCNPQFNIYFTGLVAFDVNYRITLGMLSEMQFLLLENISQGDSPETYF